MNQGPTMQSLVKMINNIMGHNVLSEQQLNKILEGAKKIYDKGGMPAVIQYLMKVTQADVDAQELTQFAENVKNNPQIGMDILEGKKSIRPQKKKR
ncbi:hypothetical protein SAMN04487866_10815 [Thermoactinomyces sp. DSM 45891]|uniref:hypothetical protein n=1 Tax=Thermoactinomyces sp. DSM 45891 TaxID=1761907 RepID=UPI000923995E|nr:hypothetical protein [Thermoactinomyces sp. DSM 45891]SFX44317.1 hypothetical protein SAMN04487866_10815 [Thermoactinomyces sp. DSM 45891]